MSTIWKNISLEYLIVQVNHYEIQIDHGIEKTLLRTLTIYVYPSLTDKKHLLQLYLDNFSHVLSGLH